MARTKIVITGGAGFIGSHLADALALESDLVVVDNLSAGKRANLTQATRAGATVVKRDLLRGDLGSIFRRADVIYHFAANPDVRLGRAGTKPSIDENVIVTHRVLEACRAAKVPQVVFPSTSTVYGEASVVPTPEDYGPLEPISVYGATKLASEALLSAYAHTFGISAVIFRLANVVGARSGHGVVVDLVRKLARDPKRLEIIGSDPGTAKSYVHVDDVVSGNCTTVMRPFTELATDLANGTVAHYVFITPNICNDMHDSCASTNNPVKQGDNWLAQNVPMILSSAAYQKAQASKNVKLKLFSE